MFSVHLLSAACMHVPRVYKVRTLQTKVFTAAQHNSHFDLPGILYRKLLVVMN